MTQLNYSDFYQVPELKFDITKLREDLDTILKKKGFASPKGVSNFGAIQEKLAIMASSIFTTMSGLYRAGFNIEQNTKRLEKEGIDLYTIGVRRASALARLGGIRKWVASNIRNPTFFPKNSGKINISAIANALKTETFSVANETEQKMLILCWF